MLYDIEITVGIENNKLTRTYKVEDPYEQLDSNKEISSMADYLSDERNLEI
jgi:hypothetical protein